MDKLITALAPVFAAGMGIQQLGELLSPLVDKISADNKKIVLGLLSLTLGLVLAFTAKLRVLQILGVTPASGLDTVDTIVTGLIISGGTEGINSILKFLKYKKEDTKNLAATKLADDSAIKPATDPRAGPMALEYINKK